MAVGVSLKKENFEKFKEDINSYIEKLNIKETKPIINVDMEVNLKDLNIQNVKELQKLEPFGEANETPIFFIRNLKIESIRAITEGEHLKLSLRDKHLQIDAIGFHMGEYTEHYKLGDKVDVLGNLEINSFGGIESIQINIKDMSKSL